MGSGVWALPGLLSPQSMSLTFSGLVGNVTLPSPWGVVNTDGVVVRAHGTQTGQDTTSYAVDFTALVPATGSVTAYLIATVTTIQQNPFPLTGPPQGHPSYNPNFIPVTAYATTAYSVALTAATGVADNLNAFEIARTTLSPGQSSVSTYSVQGWQRASPYMPVPGSVLASGGALTLAQARQMLLPGTGGLTSTLPSAVSGGGLFFRMVNPSTTTAWTVAAGTGNSIAGAGSGVAVTSVGIPPLGAMTVWGNAAAGVWEIVSVNPQMLTSLPNVFTAPQAIVDSSVGALSLYGSGSIGANIRLTGNGTATPNKFIRAANGIFNIINSLYSANILSLDDAGNFSVPGSITGGALAVNGVASISNGLSVVGGIYSTGLDAGGMQLRTALGTGPGAGFRNDGTAIYLLMSNAGAPTGGFNGLRPFTVNLTTGAMTLDGTGVGVVFGGLATIPRVSIGAGTVGGVIFPGGGAIDADGAITSNSVIFGNTIGANGNITSNGGRLRAAFGALNSGDANAAALLSDFLRITNANYLLERFPDGTIMQGFSASNSTGIDTITFPNAFPNVCSEVLVCEGNPVGWNNGAGPTIFGAQQLSTTSFVLYVTAWSGTNWALRGSISYRYIAIGY